MNFAEALKNETRYTRTENGALAYNSTLNPCLDFFSLVGALRNADATRITSLFEAAYATDKTLALRTVFYARDVRGGLGERRVFRILLTYIAKEYPDALRPFVKLLPEYGRFDDWYCLVGTPLEDDMWEAMKEQFLSDLKNASENSHEVSLLAKWVKTADASSPATRALGIKTALGLGITVRIYKKMVRDLRAYLKVVETYMSANKWDKIDYSAVPSKAMNNYRSAFGRHDYERFGQYLENVKKGVTKINASTLYPYDIVEKCLYKREYGPVLEEQWKALPNYVEGENSAIVIADVSGSMYGRPLATSVGLALYFAERNKGAYHNLFMTFSSRPQFVEVRGKTLEQKFRNICQADWNMSTNLEGALREILRVAMTNRIPKEEMVKSLIIVSDMEIDQCTHERKNFYEDMRKQFALAGYDIPNIVFWNVNSRHDIFHADANQIGVQLCSGQSAATFKSLMGAVGMNPIEYMVSVLNSKRYENIKVE